MVPTDDAGKTKKVRLSPARIAIVLGSSAAALVILVLIVLIYTPPGPLVPIPNPQLENRYNRELLSIKQRVSDLMQEQLRLRAYVVKVQKALGENAALDDSGAFVTSNKPRRGPEKLKPPGQQQIDAARRQEDGRTPVATVLDRVAVDDLSKVVFPVMMPTSGYITRGFDPNQRHFGIDVAGRTGTPVNAAAEGYVIFAGWTNDDGYVMIISHAGGFLTYYKHNQSLLKSANSFVKRGEPVAFMGNSGVTSSGPHLHFEVWKDGVPVDPAIFIVNLHL